MNSFIGFSTVLKDILNMNILILSRSAALYSTQSLVEAARLRNHFVRVIDHTLCDMMIESGRMKIFYNNQMIRNIDAIIPRIGTSATSSGVHLIRQFESLGVFSTLNSDALLLARDKIMCLQILASHGIKVPTTIVNNSLYTIPYLLNEMGSFPVVIKLVQGTHGMGVIKVDNPKMAESILEAFNTTNDKVLIQKFIKEAQGADLRAFVVDGVVIASMRRQAQPGEFRSNLHRGGSALRVDLTDKENEVAIKSTQLLGLKVAGVDILQTHHGPMVLEVNASPGLEGIENTTNVDVAGQIIQFIERNR